MLDGNRERRICLITPGHIASTPRLVKEADALAKAGYRVHVVAGRNFAPVDPLDESILARATWTCTRVNLSGGIQNASLKAGRLAARKLLHLWPTGGWGLAALAQHAGSWRMAAEAGRFPADLYRGHCLGALATTVEAARRHGAVASFDLEDYHDGETVVIENDPVEQEAIRRLQAALLPACAHLTAASPRIADAYRERYSVEPSVLLNVFPLAMAPETPHRGRILDFDHPAVFYWFSQTIGPDRGLERVIQILARMKVPAALHLRGFVEAGYRASLEQLAGREGMKGALEFLPPAAPDEMARLVAASDMGLSTEQPAPPVNRELCLTNKIFTYLLAGIPQWMTPTSAQRALASDLSEAALVDGDRSPGEEAARLDHFLMDEVRVKIARDTAWRLGRERYCWEAVGESFIKSIQNALHEQHEERV